MDKKVIKMSLDEKFAKIEENERRLGKKQALLEYEMSTQVTLEKLKGIVDNLYQQIVLKGYKTPEDVAKIEECQKFLEHIKNSHTEIHNKWGNL